MPSEIAFYAIIEGDENRRYLTRKFPAGSHPQLILGSSDGCIRIETTYDSKGNIEVIVSKGHWSMGKDLPANGIYEVIYHGPVGEKR